MLYHGSNQNFTKISSEYMNLGNNQEGIGIYFSDFEIAKRFGKYIYQTNVNPKKFINSRDYISKYINVLKFLKELFKYDSEEIIMLLQDYGLEVFDENDITPKILKDLAKELKYEEVRNFQIEFYQRYRDEFVNIWMKLYPNILGTKKDNIFCIINTSVKIEKYKKD